MQNNRAWIVLLASALLFIYTFGLIPVSKCKGSTKETEASCSKKASPVSSKQMQKLVKMRFPVLPPGNLHNSKLHGTATVEVCIDSNGILESIKVISGHPMAYGSVIESVRSWIFVPYHQRGQDMPAIGLIKVNYDFRSKRMVLTPAIDRKRSAKVPGGPVPVQH
jgi:hypothetical protein